jgi:hypothetical protein
MEPPPSPVPALEENPPVLDDWVEEPPSLVSPKPLELELEQAAHASVANSATGNREERTLRMRDLRT